VSLKSPGASARNERILAWVESLVGGGPVWEAEVFAITLMDLAAPEAEVTALTEHKASNRLDWPGLTAEL
jgi:hypothetical protein